MAAWSPSQEATIAPYVAGVLPFGDELATTVRAACPERTFWEKATILHQEANRSEDKPVPRRYSRHCYDMYKLGHSFVLEGAPDALRDSCAGLASAESYLSPTAAKEGVLDRAWNIVVNEKIDPDL